MEALHITLTSLTNDVVELRAGTNHSIKYDDRRLNISEIQDLIGLCTRDYYALQPQIQTIGRKLYQWIDGDGRWLTQAIENCGSSVLVIAIAPSKQLAHLPWEVLHDGDDFLVAKSYPWIAPIRWVDKPMEELPPQDEKSLQVLFMATSPIDVKPVLNFEGEESEILQITQNFPLTLRVEESGCVKELTNVWSRYTQNTFDIFHLTGHANLRSESPHEPYFITETLTGKRAETTPKQLRQAFGARRPRLVFLSGCRTGESGRDGTVPSFAETLIDRGLPAVMGWGRPVRDITATKCAATLYERLAAGDSLAAALNQTYQALIADEKMPDWHLLRLYVRGESWGALVNPPEFYVPPQPIQDRYFLDDLRLSPVATAEQYVGRRRLLQTALRSLQSGKYSGLMLHGMGGLGKSSTAARLLDRLPDYEPMVFFREIDQQKLERSLFKQCKSEIGKGILESKLDLMQKLTKFFDQGLNSPRQRFVFVLDDFEANLDVETNDRALLKPDVVPVIEALLEALWQCRTPHRLLITSRYDVRFPGLNDSIDRMPLASLKDADLRKKCDRLQGFQSPGERSETQKDAIALADGNPRLLEWLDAVLLDESIESSRILDSLAQTEAKFRENILAEQLLDQQSREIRTILTRMQIFELPVPFEAVEAICPEIENLTGHCQKAIALGLLEWNGFGQPSYRLPRIFQSLLDPIEDISIYAKGTEALYQNWWEKESINEGQALELIRLATQAEHYEIKDEVSSRLGVIWEGQGRYREAGYIWEEIRINRQIRFGDKHPSTAASTNNLALVYRSQGRYEEAAPLFIQTLEIRKALFGNEHPDVADSIHNLALCFRSRGLYENAKSLYIEALEIRKKLLGNEHPDVAQSTHDLAGVYNKLGHYEEAEALCIKALKVFRQNFGDQNLLVANSLNSLALLYINHGRNEKATPLLIQALKVRKQILGNEHPHVADSINNLAFLYSQQEQYIKAEPLYIRALELSKKSLGNEHPDVATSSNNLAFVYHRQGRYRKAKDLYIQALEIMKKVLGDEHPHVAMNINNLALLYCDEGHYKESETLYIRAWKILENAFGNMHPDVANSIYNLALLYSHQGRYEEADPLYINAINTLRQCLGDQHPKTQTVLNHFVRCLNAAIEAGHDSRLPAHPLTQNLLKQLRSTDS